MEQTLVIIKPSAIHRGLIGDIITRFQRKGLIITGMKMMQLDETILRAVIRQQQGPVSMSVAHIMTKGHVDVPGLVCCLEPC